MSYTFKTIQIIKPGIYGPSPQFFEELTHHIACGNVGTQEDRLSKLIRITSGTKEKLIVEGDDLSKMNTLAQALSCKYSERPSGEAFLNEYGQYSIVKQWLQCMSKKLIEYTIDMSRKSLNTTEGFIEDEDDDDIVYTPSTALYCLERVFYTSVTLKESLFSILPPTHHANRAKSKGFCFINTESLFENVTIVDLDINARHETLEEYLLENKELPRIFDVCSTSAYPLAGKKNALREKDKEFQSDVTNEQTIRYFIDTKIKGRGRRKSGLRKLMKRLEQFLESAPNKIPILISLGLDSISNRVTDRRWGHVFTEDEYVTIVRYIKAKAQEKGCTLRIKLEGGYDNEVNTRVIKELYTHMPLTREFSPEDINKVTQKYKELMQENNDTPKKTRKGLQKVGTKLTKYAAIHALAKPELIDISHRRQNDEQLAISYQLTTLDKLATLTEEVELWIATIEKAISTINQVNLDPSIPYQKKHTYHETHHRRLKNIPICDLGSFIKQRVDNYAAEQGDPEKKILLEAIGATQKLNDLLTLLHKYLNCLGSSKREVAEYVSPNRKRCQKKRSNVKVPPKKKSRKKSKQQTDMMTFCYLCFSVESIIFPMLFGSGLRVEQQQICNRAFKIFHDWFANSGLYIRYINMPYKTIAYLQTILSTKYKASVSHSYIYTILGASIDMPKCENDMHRQTLFQVYMKAKHKSAIPSMPGSFKIGEEYRETMEQLYNQYMGMLEKGEMYSEVLGPVDKRYSKVSSPVNEGYSKISSSVAVKKCGAGMFQIPRQKNNKISITLAEAELKYSITGLTTLM